MSPGLLPCLRQPMMGLMAPCPTDSDHGALVSCWDVCFGDRVVGDPVSAGDAGR